MRQRIKTPVKIATVSSQSVTFHGNKKISTQARINQLLTLLNIDRDIHKFQTAIREAERMISKETVNH
jgi:hypothetical protein